MFETSILAKNLIKSYFEEVGNEDTPILDKFDKLIGKYLKGASCDACLTNLHGYLSEMWDKGLNEKLIHEFIEELTKYVDESTASKINKGLKFTESLEESNKSLKESKLSLSDLCDTLGISWQDIVSIRYDDNKGTSYVCNDIVHIGIKILYNEAIQLIGVGDFIGAFNFNKYKIYSEPSYFVLEDDKLRYLEIYLK